MEFVRRPGAGPLKICSRESRNGKLKGFWRRNNRQRNRKKILCFYSPDLHSPDNLVFWPIAVNRRGHTASYGGPKRGPVTPDYALEKIETNWQLREIHASRPKKAFAAREREEPID
jgi:hypothetical protein